MEGLALARTRLSYATVSFPFDRNRSLQERRAGRVRRRGDAGRDARRPGEVWLRGYIAETDLGRVKLGQRAGVTTDTYPGKMYEGRVSFISSEAEFTPKSVQTQKERVKLVYRIKINVRSRRWS